MDDDFKKKVRSAKSAAELKEYAIQSGFKPTDEEAAEYYAKMNRVGELEDEELDNVAGGGCHSKDGRLVVTNCYICDDYSCRRCRADRAIGDHFHNDGIPCQVSCLNCVHSVVEKGLRLCNK